LLMPSGNVKITDFGLSHQTGASSSVYSMDASHVKIPIKWSAPEVITGFKFSKKADVWSFGVTMWEIIERELPFEEIPSGDVAALVVKKSLKLAKPSATDLPEDLWLLMQQCWELDPKQRPSFEQLHAELQQIKKKLPKDEACEGPLRRDTVYSSDED